MYKVAINASNLHSGGGVQVATSFIRELVGISHLFDFEITLIISSTVFENINSLNTETSKFRRIVIVDIYGLQALKPKYKKYFEGFDLIFTIFGPNYSIFKSVVNIVGFAQPWIIYPDNEVYKSLRPVGKIKSKIKYNIQTFFFKKSDHLIVELDHVKSRLVENLGFSEKKIDVINNSVSDVFLSQVEIKKPKEKNDRFNIGFLGRDYPHKNIDILVDVKLLLRAKHGIDVNVFLTLNEQEWGARSEAFKSNVINLGVLKVSECPSFYSNMDMVIFPSLLECFSATPLEAMISNVPLLASDRPFVRDVCQEHAIYFDPLNADEIANKVADYINSPTINLDKASKHAREFSSSKNRAIKYMKLIDKKLKECI